MIQTPNESILVKAKGNLLLSLFILISFEAVIVNEVIGHLISVLTQNYTLSPLPQSLRFLSLQLKFEDA